MLAPQGRALFPLTEEGEARLEGCSTNDVYLYIMQRTQIYLDDEQHRSLTALARQRNATASSLIRAAIDDYLAAQLTPREKLDRLRALGAKFASSVSDEHSDAREAVDSIRATDAARLNSLG